MAMRQSATVWTAMDRQVLKDFNQAKEASLANLARDLGKTRQSLDDGEIANHWELKIEELNHVVRPWR